MIVQSNAPSNAPSNALCTLCKGILTDYTIKHTPDACPLRSSLTCTYCNIRGHSNVLCPNKKKSYMCVPSPIHSRDITHPPTLDIRSDDKSITAYIRSQGYPPSHKPKKNLELLQQITDSQRLFLKKKTSL